ncbi:MAG: hypothetical protein JWP12_1732 [Bacteroidetes bacterium]|nr:hypothetical protein [Bacteroidota bacterium]
MERTLKLFFVFICSLFLFSCEKKETPVPAYDRGDAITATVEMTSSYKNQVWFRLNDHMVVYTNLKSAWDLAFECSASGTHVLLNTSKSMRIYKTNFTDLSQVNDTVGLGVHGTSDNPSGSLDSTATGDWQSNNTVYVVNRGYNELAQQQGYYKLKITGMSATTFSIEYADIYGTSGTNTATITKDADKSFVTFSLGSNLEVITEPAKTDFDLCFTQYTHVFYSPFQYYLVTGVLINRYNTRVIGIPDKTFNAITINDTLNKTFSAAQNAIGYDWKTYDIATNVYTVDVTKCYIISDSRGFYYKLHFIDFYNSSGVKGYPEFEYKKL